MASSDDFREQIKTGNITDALATALTKAVELKVTTWVASESDDIEATAAKPGHRLRTRINMIEGKLENEIGDQFIANGRYRELRQFHLDQVADGNKIIQNNLRSLQKLFEILVAMRDQGTTPPVIEANSSGVESPRLPSTEAIAKPQAFPEPSFSSTTPVDSLQELDSDDDEDDWDDSVLDLLESLPVAPPPSPNTLDPQFDEDRRNLIEELEIEPPTSNPLVHRDWATLTQEDVSPTSPTPNTAAPQPQIDENLGELIQEEPKPKPLLSNSPVNQNWAALTQEEFEPPTTSLEPNLEALNLDNDEDWGDLVEVEPEPQPTLANSLIHEDLGMLTQVDSKSPTISPQPTGEELKSKADEDWGWGDLIEELEPNSVPFSRVNQPLPTASPQPNIEATNFDSNEDWGDLVEAEPKPNQDKSVPNMESLDLEEDGDWDDWDVEEPESVQNQPTPVNDPEILALDEDEDWGDLLEDTDFATAPADKESEASDKDWDGFAIEELKPDSNFIDVEAQTMAEDDLDTKGKSVDKRVPPPPPPTRFPNQNNNK